MKISTTLTFYSPIALAAAQFRFNETDNTFICTKDKGLAAYCAGGDIIIRCANGIGQPGNCNDNLAGYPPYGNNGLAGCYQTTRMSGDAACTKNGLVYPGSGAADSSDTASFPIPSTTAASTPAGTGVPLATGTGSAALPNDQNPMWSNITTTAVTAADGPAYTAGTTMQVSTIAAPSNSASPQVFTGLASSQSSESMSTYWAFIICAVVAFL